MSARGPVIKSKAEAIQMGSSFLLLFPNGACLYSSITRNMWIDHVLRHWFRVHQSGGFLGAPVAAAATGVRGALLEFREPIPPLCSLAQGTFSHITEIILSSMTRHPAKSCSNGFSTAKQRILVSMCLSIPHITCKNRQNPEVCPWDCSGLAPAHRPLSARTCHCPCADKLKEAKTKQAYLLIPMYSFLWFLQAASPWVCYSTEEKFAPLLSVLLLFCINKGLLSLRLALSGSFTNSKIIFKRTQNTISASQCGLFLIC